MSFSKSNCNCECYNYNLHLKKPVNYFCCIFSIQPQNFPVFSTIQKFYVLYVINSEEFRFYCNLKVFLSFLRKIKRKPTVSQSNLRWFLWCECSCRTFQKTPSYQRFFGFQSNKFPCFLLHRTLPKHKRDWLISFVNYFLSQSGDYTLFVLEELPQLIFHFIMNKIDNSP